MNVEAEASTSIRLRSGSPVLRTPSPESRIPSPYFSSYFRPAFS